MVNADLDELVLLQRLVPEHYRLINKPPWPWYTARRRWTDGVVAKNGEVIRLWVLRDGNRLYTSLAAIQDFYDRLAKADAAGLDARRQQAQPEVKKSKPRPRLRGRHKTSRRRAEAREAGLLD